MQTQSFKNLIAWQEAHQLAITIYHITATFPRNEQFGLTNQMRRAAVSITSNIAEGSTRWTAADKKHFYVIASGSANELESQLLIAQDIGYLQAEACVNILRKKEGVSRPLYKLTHSVKNHPKHTTH